MLDGQISEALAGELAETHHVLVQACASLADLGCSSSQVEEVLISVAQAAESLLQAAQMMESEGLEILAEWLASNAELLHDQPSDQRAQAAREGLLEAWAVALTDLLRQPSDALASDRLRSQLMRPDWPDPATDELIALVFADLCQTATNEFVPATSLESPAPRALPASYIWSDDLDPKLKAAFFHETPELAASLAEILRQSGSVVVTGDVMARAKRIAHTLKGNAGLVGIEPLETLSHALEDFMEVLPQELTSGELNGFLSEAADCLEGVFDALSENAPPPAELDAIVNGLARWRSQLEEQASTRSVVAEPAPNAEPENANAEIAHEGILRIPVNVVDELMRLVGELTIGIGQLQGRLLRAKSQSDAILHQDGLVHQRLSELETLAESTATFARLPESHLDDGFDPLEMDRYHELHSLTSAFIEAMSDSRQFARSLNEDLDELRNLLHEQERLGREFNQSVLSTRMLPVTRLLPRLERTVRSAARKRDKQVELKVLGQDLMVDTDILNTLLDPLMHLLRNAVDHGIETPQQRAVLGKPVSGQIQVEFVREGNSISVRVSDDGQGIDAQAIRHTAFQRGVLNALESVSDEEALRLILLPGFSTKGQVDTLSGRGIGMEVVQRAVDELHGGLEIDTVLGSKTEFTLRLPLTLVSVPVLLVRVVGQVFAIPSTAMDQLLFAEPGSVRREGEGWLFEYGRESWPVRGLAELIGGQLEDDFYSQSVARPVLLVRADQGVEALLVDEALANREVVVKSLGAWLPRIPGVSGACVLEDASVAPVLDLLRLMREGSGYQLAPAQVVSPRKELIQGEPILVVDDSLSARTALSNAVKAAGFEPITAIDGLDAIQVLEDHEVVAVLADLEMPRMNGLELIRHLRARSDTRDLPLIVVTSRSGEKHRKEAELVGADDYLTKPFDATQLRERLGQLLEVA